MVYKDIEPLKTTLDNNNNILNELVTTFETDNPRMISFRAEVRTHISLLTQISQSLELKVQEIFADTKRYKRGLINGIGTFWKAITGNLDSSDGEYYTNCINKLSNDEHQLENLLKNQISVTTSVIKSFNSTIQKLKIDEETFNKDIKEIENSIYDIADDLAYIQAKLRVLELCESLMESYMFLENSLDNILNSITFARLKILHSSIITPKDLVTSLQEISQSLHKNNLPITPQISKVAQYFDIIELQAFQAGTKIIFVLKIPLTEPESYTLYHLYPIPILDNRTGLHHILSTTHRYIAKDDDSLLFVPLQNLDNCKVLNPSVRLCSNVLPYPIDSDAICEAQILRQLSIVPRTCQSNLLFAKDYNIQKLKDNKWLISVSESLPVTIKCNNRDVVTKIINTNSILKLQSECNAFIGSTRVHASSYQQDNITYNHHPVLIPYECCNHIPDKHKLPKLKPLKLSNLNTDDLNIAKHKLDQYSDDLDKLINEPFITKNISWFTYLTITLIVVLIILYVTCKCKRRRRDIRIGISSSDDQPPQPPPDPKSRILRSYGRLLPKRRPNINVSEPMEDIELSSSYSKSYA